MEMRGKDKREDKRHTERRETKRQTDGEKTEKNRDRIKQRESKKDRDEREREYEEQTPQIKPEKRQNKALYFRISNAQFEFAMISINFDILNRAQ